MGILTDDMKRVVSEQKLGFYATVCPDGTPNLSPKGTTVVWDDDHIAFCNIRSPQTIRNLEANPAIEMNIVDPVVRKGYRFKGVARIIREGDVFDKVRTMFSDDAAARTSAIVVVEIQKAQPLTSPAYDWGTTEDELRSIYKQRLVELYGPF
ncbi:MAG TPA: pyridoxamine 5'-phosphate oxidase family protein [Actinomycetota bacterium]|jgi:predicted pyridoxine 5'-phosphate oxidase superfamily flavin-nucleotide-binding protein|nr:pyridoxamine 5'-phosphate oxidase family protein [Actinomycetota bacterium]